MNTHFLQEIDTNWTLFLDRDGVLNYEKDQDYIRDVSEFEFYPNVLESLQKARVLFKRIIIVTNQRGVGRNLMTHDDLNAIHDNMIALIEQHGGRIAKIYYAPDIDKDAYNRKPNIGMGVQAQKDFPDIDFKKSIMVGNNLSDMEFGKKLGMFTVFVETTQHLASIPNVIDLKIASFPKFCELL